MLSKSIYAPPSTFDLEDTENSVIVPGKWRQTTAGDTGIVILRELFEDPQMTLSQ
jgi:hypothetical protein